MTQNVSRAVALRLVGGEVEGPGGRSAAVARENASAALGADDARRALARRVERSLEGGRAAILRPEARRDLVAGAVREGLRPFDANLVIAVVQEAVRRGEAVEVGEPEGVGERARADDGARTAPMLGLIPPAREQGPGVLGLALAAASLAVVIVGLLVAWLTNAW